MSPEPVTRIAFSSSSLYTTEVHVGGPCSELLHHFIHTPLVKTSQMASKQLREAEKDSVRQIMDTGSTNSLSHKSLA